MHFDGNEKNIFCTELNLWMTLRVCVKASTEKIFGRLLLPKHTSKQC